MFNIYVKYFLFDYYFSQKNRNYCIFATIKPSSKCLMCTDLFIDKAEKLKAIVTERIRLMESGEATYIDGEEGFAQIRMRFGL